MRQFMSDATIVALLIIALATQRCSIPLHSKTDLSRQPDLLLFMIMLTDKTLPLRTLIMAFFGLSVIGNPPVLAI